MKKPKYKVGMVQINNSFDQQNYLPLSLGFLHSYAAVHAKNFSDYEFLPPIYKRIPVDAALKQLEGADIVCFSTYVWNFELSKAIAKSLPKKTLVVFGGCHVPDIPQLGHDPKGFEKFLRDHPFIDLASSGEGELVFSSLLESYPSKSWGDVPSIGRTHKGHLHTTPLPPRIEDLNQIPSPYLSGYFKEVMKSNPDEGWIGLFETNRGCPFKCSYCDWGIGAKKRMADYDLEERVLKEVDWFSEYKIPFVYCCDANFGMFKDRDLAIANKFADNKRVYGYPQRLSVQNTKNSTESSYNIQKVLVENGLDKGVLLAFQSLNTDTLKAIARKNIKLDTYFELQRRFTADGVATFSDFILGLPMETYDTLRKGINVLLEAGQHNRIQFNNLSILPNAPIVEDLAEYEIETVESDMINIHGSLGEWVDDIYEKQQLVVANSTMPRTDWVKARAYCYMVSFLHFNKILQIPNIILNSYLGIKYTDIFDAFMNADNRKYPYIHSISQFFTEQAKDLQAGNAEYCYSEEWLGIWWPADELALIKVMAEDGHWEFYQEAGQILSDVVDVDSEWDKIIFDCIWLNQHLMKVPFIKLDFMVNLDHNIVEVYQNALQSKKVPLKSIRLTHTIDRTSQAWTSWKDWSREVVWWGNKKGDYIYDIK